MKLLIADDEPMVLEETLEVIQQVATDAEIFCGNNYLDSLKIAEEHVIDVALLDVEMPGMDGLELSKRLKTINPKMNIIFVTAFASYALDAFSLYASGYLIKPLRIESARKALNNLRFDVEKTTTPLRVQCFGKFEVFYNDEPLTFPRARAKELFAYLVDLKGAAANTGELCGILFEDSTNLESNRHYLRNLIGDLRKTLHHCGLDDVFYSKRNQFAIDPDKIRCDYYEYLKGNEDAIRSYGGEYMKQYSWAEYSFEPR